MHTGIFQRYIWLVNTIANGHGISMEEINNRWAKSSINEKHEGIYPRRSFLRHKEEIAEIFGIEIMYNRAKNAYVIDSVDTIHSNELRRWLLNNFAVNNALVESRSIEKRILVEPIPEGTHYLPTIVQAMRESHALLITHNRFGQAAHVFVLEPYCLKIFKQRWYIYGQPSDHPNERRIYALDRISDIKELTQTFSLPKGFDAEKEFSDYYGTFTDKEVARVRVRVVEKGAYFLRTLPLHHSQKEIEQTPDYSEFEFIIAPTYDFIQQLRTFGSQLTVLSPEWLREEMKQEAAHTLANYNK